MNAVHYCRACNDFSTLAKVVGLILAIGLVAVFVWVDR